MSESLSQDDLDALFGGLTTGTEDAEPKETKPKIEAPEIESAEGGENLTQEQIDALLKEMLGD